MTLEYRFFDRSDEVLIATSELPVEDGIAVAVRTTGFDTDSDEVVSLSIVDLEGNELFSRMVKPQNVEDWRDDAAAGGITPADVQDADELFQFEEQVSELFENASIVVAQHAAFLHEAVEQSWISLPPYDSFDIVKGFCESHCAADYPSQSAAVATLAGIAGYYGVECDESTTTGIARTVAACYQALVREHAEERLAKGAEHWERYERKLQEERENDAGYQAQQRAQAKRTYLINALLWLIGGGIFANLAVRMLVSGADAGFGIIAGAVAVFCVIRWGMCLNEVRKLRK